MIRRFKIKKAGGESHPAFLCLNHLFYQSHLLDSDDLVIHFKLIEIDA